MKILMNDETLFKNIEVFDNDFMPDKFGHRDNQLKALSMCINPGLKGSKPSNALILGTTATGKTTSIKLIFNELKEYREKIIPIHINCQVYNTEYKTFCEIYKNMFGYSPPASGLPASELFNEIFDHLSKKKKVLLIVLDDCELLFNKESSTIYNILRGYEIYPNAKSAVWCITHKNIMHTLEDKTRSIFHPEIIEYQKYTQKELVEILSDRAEYGLYEGVISKQLIELIAENSFDLRYAIEYLKRSVLLAESEASKKVTEKHVRKILNLQ